MTTKPAFPTLAVDEHAARRVAAGFLERERHGAPSLVRAAYAQLVEQTDELLHELTTAWWPGLRLEPTDLLMPYGTDEELIEGVRATSILEIPRSDHDRRHALLGWEPGGEHDRVRALHDLLGHVLPEFGFDRDGEYSAWSLQDRHHRGLARWALATELHAHHSVRWTTGELAEPRAVLIDPRLVHASLASGRLRHTTACHRTDPYRVYEAAGARQTATTATHRRCSAVDANRTR